MCHPLVAVLVVGLNGGPRAAGLGLVTGAGHLAKRSAGQMNVVDVMPFWSYDFYSVEPTFTVVDWPAARPLMAAYLDKVRAERGAMFCGWTVCGNKLFCREGFHDAGAVRDHLANVKGTVEQLLSGPATLDAVELHGPTDGLASCEEAMRAYGSTRYFSIDSGCTFLVRPYAGMSRGQSFFSLHPTFTVHDWGAARPLLDESVERMRQASGCIYFGWTRSGDTLSCRQAYLNAAGVLAHLESVDPLVDRLLDSGAATLTGVSVQGPPTRLDEVEAALADYHGLAPHFYALDAGFQKFECSGFNLGMLDYSKYD